MNINDAKNIPLHLLVDHLGGKYSHTDLNKQVWYYSPFRPTEKTASFKINEKTNRWFDFGHVSRSSSGSGGDIVDLWCDYHGTDRRRNFKEALEALQPFTNMGAQHTTVEQRRNDNEVDNVSMIDLPRFKILKLHDHIFYNNLIAELNKRRISKALAEKYLKQVYLGDVLYPERKRNGFAFANDKGGYEISVPYPDRGTSFKTSIRPKAPTTFRDRLSSKLFIFEGMWDFLSWLEMQGSHDIAQNVIVLNSLSFCAQAAAMAVAAKKRDEIDAVMLFLDNDEAGIKATHFMLEELEEANIITGTMETLYKGYKDMGEYWVMSQALKY